MLALTLLGLLLSQAQLGSIFNSEGKWAKLKFISLMEHFTLCPQALRQTLAMDTKDISSHWGKQATLGPLQPVMGGGAEAAQEGP